MISLVSITSPESSGSVRSRAIAGLVAVHGSSVARGLERVQFESGIYGALASKPFCR